MQKARRGGCSRRGEKPKELPFGSPLGQYKFIFYSPHPNRWNILIEGGYTLPTKTLPTSRHIRLGFSVVVLQGLPRSPQSSMLSMPTATPHAVLVRSGSTFSHGSTPLPNGGQGEVGQPLLRRVLRLVGSVAPPLSLWHLYYTTPKSECQWIFCKRFVNELWISGSEPGLKYLQFGNK